MKCDYVVFTLRELYTVLLRHTRPHVSSEMAHIGHLFGSNASIVKSVSHCTYMSTCYSCFCTHYDPANIVSTLVSKLMIKKVHSLTLMCC